MIVTKIEITSNGISKRPKSRYTVLQEIFLKYTIDEYDHFQCFLSTLLFDYHLLFNYRTNVLLNFHAIYELAVQIKRAYKSRTSLKRN